MAGRSSGKRDPKVEEALSVARQSVASGNLEAAEQAFLEALSLAKRARAFADAVSVLLELAEMQARRNESEALNSLAACEDLARRHLSEQELANVLGKVASSLTRLTQREAAKAKYREAMEIALQAGDCSSWAEKLCALYEMNRDEGRYSECYRICREAVELCESRGEMSALITVTFPLIEMLRDIFEAPELARDHAKRLSLLIPLYGSEWDAVKLEYESARMQVKFGQLEAAEQSLGRVAMASRYHGDSSLLLKARLVLAEVCVHRQRVEALSELLDYLGVQPETPSFAQLQMLRTRIALHQLRYREAVESIEQVPKLTGWSELERAILLAVVEWRMGVADQALAFLNYAEQVLEEIKTQVPVEFQTNLERKPEVLELRELKEVMR